MKKYIIIFFAIISTYACDSSLTSTESTLIITKPVDYGNGVLYFPSIEKDFAASLSSYLQDTTKLIVSIAGDGSGIEGRDNGYFVVIKEK